MLKRWLLHALEKGGKQKIGKRRGKMGRERGGERE